MKNMNKKIKKELKGFCHKWDWRWDHPFPGDVGEDGRWELSLYSIDDLTEDGYVGYVALAQLENGQWVVVFTIDEEEERFEFTQPTLAEAKHALDTLLGANTPDIPADRDAADPWFGEEALHKQILGQMLGDPECVQKLTGDVDAILKHLPKGSSPFEPRPDESKTERLMHQFERLIEEGVLEVAKDANGQPIYRDGEVVYTWSEKGRKEMELLKDSRAEEKKRRLTSKRKPPEQE
jgi:hypothetical protein